MFKQNDTHWSVVGAGIVGGASYDWMKESSFFSESTRLVLIEEKCVVSPIDLLGVTILLYFNGKTLSSLY